MRRLSHVLGALALVAVSCKEPVEDRVAPPPPPPPPPQVRDVPRGQPPPEAKAYVLREAPPIRYKAEAKFEGQIQLLGYDVPKTRFRPGEQVPVTMYFKALADVTDNWQLFMHLDPEGVDDSGIRGFGDHWPVFGLYPTKSWKAGDVIRDQITITMPPNVNKPKAILWVGFYQGDRRAKLEGKPTDGKARFGMANFEVDSFGETPAGKSYRVFRTPEKLNIDGKLDEPAWQKVATTGRFVRTTGGVAKQDTWAKMLWDDEYLYIGFHCLDSDIRTPYTKRDEPLWQADTVEVFLDPSGKGENYVELQVSPANVIFDAFFPKRLPPPNRGGDLDYTVNMKTAVHVDGTLNKPGDVDKSYTVEMAIPFKDLKFAPNTPPKEGDIWRMNLIRIERTSGEFDDSAWSAPGNDYHELGKMGRVMFAGLPGKVAMDPRFNLKVKQLPTGLEGAKNLRERLKLKRPLPPLQAPPKP